MAEEILFALLFGVFMLLVIGAMILVELRAATVANRKRAGSFVARALSTASPFFPRGPKDGGASTVPRCLPPLPM